MDIKSRALQRQSDYHAGNCNTYCNNTSCWSVYISHHLYLRSARITGSLCNKINSRLFAVIQYQYPLWHEKGHAVVSSILDPLPVLCACCDFFPSGGNRKTLITHLGKELDPHEPNFLFLIFTAELFDCFIK